MAARHNGRADSVVRESTTSKNRERQNSMKLARVMTALGVALTASSVMSGVAYADFVCEDVGPVNQGLVCVDDEFDTGYVATSIASATTVTVFLNNGDGTIVRGDTAGFDVNGKVVANAATVDPGGSDSDTANPGELPIVTHDVRLFAG